jgi:hypothetical protein
MQDGLYSARSRGGQTRRRARIQLLFLHGVVDRFELLLNAQILHADEQNRLSFLDASVVRNRHRTSAYSSICTLV